MLQRGLSNRPTGAVALLMITGGLLFNVWLADRPSRMITELLLGARGQEMVAWVNHAGRVAHQLAVWLNDAVDGSANRLGCDRKKTATVEVAAPRPLPPKPGISEAIPRPVVMKAPVVAPVLGVIRARMLATAPSASVRTVSCLRVTSTPHRVALAR